LRRPGRGESEEGARRVYRNRHSNHHHHPADHLALGAAHIAREVPPPRSARPRRQTTWLYASRRAVHVPSPLAPHSSASEEGPLTRSTPSSAETAERSRPLRSVKTIAPIAPKTVNCSSTSIPITVVAAHPSANKTGIATAHAKASLGRPCPSKAIPCPPRRASDAVGRCSRYQTGTTHRDYIRVACSVAAPDRGSRRQGPRGNAS